MMAMASDKLLRLGASVESRDMGSQQVRRAGRLQLRNHFSGHRPCLLAREGLTLLLTPTPSSADSQKG